MSAYRIKLPFVRSFADKDAETAMGMLGVAYLKQDAPKAPRGMRVGVHISTSATDRGILGIATLVLEALDGIAWESRACVKAMDVVVGEEESDPGWTDVWVHLEEGNE